MITSMRQIEEGVRIGRLTVMLKITYRRKVRCICICDCGESKCIRAECLAKGWTNSCGCHRREFTRWNKGLKGLKLSPKMNRKGFEPHHKLPIGSETTRRDKGKGSPRVYRKVAEPNVWKLRAVLVWESINGVVPKGKVIHHRDRNSMNDIPTNLECLTRAEHAREHAKERDEDGKWI